MKTWLENIESRSFYFITLAAAMAAYIAWIVLVDTQPYSDFLYYHKLAGDIAKGGQWGDTYTSVGYPIVLGFVFKVFGAHLVVAKLFNLFLSLANGLLLLAILPRLDLPEWGRKTLFVIVLFFPATIYYNSIAGSEILFTALLLAVTLLYLCDIDRKYFWLGLMVAAAAMVKPFFLAFFLVIFLSDYLGNGKPLTVSLRNSLIVLAVSALVISPWIYRNSVLMGQFTLISNNGGIVLYLNNNSTNDMGHWMAPEAVEDSLVLEPEYIEANPTERNNMLTAAALRWITSHPGRFLYLGCLRLYKTYIVTGDMSNSLNESGLSEATVNLLDRLERLIRMPVFWLGYLSMLVYAFVTLRHIFRRGRGCEGVPFFLLVTFCMFVVVYFITEGKARFSFPTVFITAYFLVYGLSRVAGQYQGIQAGPDEKPV